MRRSALTLPPNYNSRASFLGITAWRVYLLLIYFHFELLLYGAWTYFWIVGITSELGKCCNCSHVAVFASLTGSWASIRGFLSRFRLHTSNFERLLAWNRVHSQHKFSIFSFERLAMSFHHLVNARHFL